MGHIETCPNVPPHDILRKIRFIINSKCPSAWLTFIFTNGESNSQKEKNIGISILVIKVTQKRGKKLLFT